jgi:2'-hydroxyisoflavone reductase
LTTTKEISGSDARFTWASTDFLLENEIIPFQNMPMWIVPKRTAIMMGSNARAKDAGLTLQPIADTIRDTLPYAQEMAADIDEETQPFGISRARERELLAAWSSK